MSQWSLKQTYALTQGFVLREFLYALWHNVYPHQMPSKELAFNCLVFCPIFGITWIVNRASFIALELYSGIISFRTTLIIFTIRWTVSNMCAFYSFVWVSCRWTTFHGLNFDLFFDNSFTVNPLKQHALKWIKCIKRILSLNCSKNKLIMSSN